MNNDSPISEYNITLQNSTGKQGLLYCTNDVNPEIGMLLRLLQGADWLAKILITICH